MPSQTPVVPWTEPRNLIVPMWPVRNMRVPSFGGSAVIVALSEVIFTVMLDDISFSFAHISRNLGESCCRTRRTLSDSQAFGTGV